MSTPKLTREQAIQMIEKALGENHAPVVVLGVRGYFKNTMGAPGVNDRGIYDDAMFIVTPDCFAAFNANTDPSVMRRGIATLIPGVYWYRPGQHAIGKKSEHAAFRQDGRVTVLRDGATAPETDTAADPFWINLHKGGEWTTSSEGCQTVIKSQWASFHAMLTDQLKRYNAKRFPYVLTEA